MLIALRLLLGPEWVAGGGVHPVCGMGLFGEYIGRIYTDVRVHPCYFVQKVVGEQQIRKIQEEE